MAKIDHEKELVAKHAVGLVSDGMIIGLGTGTTSAFAIAELGRRVRAGLRITAVASSIASEKLAISLGIPMLSFDGLSRLDLTIDGADEIDGNLYAVKGGGGALTREKIIASASDVMVAIVDSNKLVAKIGKSKVPIEVLPFASSWVEKSVQSLGAVVSRRRNAAGEIFTTDQNNFILDLVFEKGYDPAQLASALDSIPGILEHGLFLKEIDVLIVGSGETVQVKRRLA
jgi:ribose 5-phosphate isomerase A